MPRAFMKKALLERGPALCSHRRSRRFKGATAPRFGRLELDAGRSSSAIRDGRLATERRECLFGCAQFLREVLHECPAD